MTRVAATAGPPGEFQSVDSDIVDAVITEIRDSTGIHASPLLRGPSGRNTVDMVADSIMADMEVTVNLDLADLADLDNLTEDEDEDEYDDDIEVIL